MKSTSHQLLANYLTDIYLNRYSSSCKKAFAIGCVQPDKNPTTYLKGSIRSQWLRGHNWENARRYIRRIGKRLERKHRFHVSDFYQLGKLIHYTADAFTYAHNDLFSETLADHRGYESRLHKYLIGYLDSMNGPVEDNIPYDLSTYEFITRSHSRYMRSDPGIHTDAQYCVHACRHVLFMLLLGKEVFEMEDPGVLL